MNFDNTEMIVDSQSPWHYDIIVNHFHGKFTPAKIHFILPVLSKHMYIYIPNLYTPTQKCVFFTLTLCPAVLLPLPTLINVFFGCDLEKYVMSQGVLSHMIMIFFSKANFFLYWRHRLLKRVGRSVISSFTQQ